MGWRQHLYAECAPLRDARGHPERYNIGAHTLTSWDLSDLMGRSERQPPDLAQLCDTLASLPDGGQRLLELARAVKSKGLDVEAARIETRAIALQHPSVTHEWRQEQAARARANQFLLLNDRARTAAFEQAIKACINRESHVLEIGTGAGLLTLLAARAGPRLVTSCEHQPLMAAIAAEIIAENGFRNLVRVVAKSSFDLEVGEDLPDQADILMGDHFTGSLLEAGGLRIFSDARRRLLKPDGIVIPSAASLRGALVGGRKLERLCRIDQTSGFNLSRFNLFSPPVLPLTPERFSNIQYQRHSLAQDLFRFDFNSLDGFESNTRTAEFRCTEAGEILGLLQWVRVELTDTISLEAHESSNLNWPRFLHVFPEPISAKAGKNINIHLEHNLQSFSAWPA